MDPEYSDGGDDSVGSKVKNGVLELIEFIAVVAAILVVIRFFVAEPHRVSGTSMVPNFHDGDYIITNKLITRIGDLNRAEVIIVKNPRNSDQVLIKRIIGMPGERVKISEGHIFINDRLLVEPYLPKGLLTPGGTFLQEGDETTIPEDHYFVVGDNRGGSSDSREWGPINKADVIGQALLRYWPPQRFTILKIGQPSL